jgi:hypothetical protein
VHGDGLAVVLTATVVGVLAAVVQCGTAQVAEATLGGDRWLVGAELVTNAVLHARTALILTLELSPDLVRVSVKDRSSAPAVLRRQPPEALNGRGLAMVSAVSRAWGVDPAGVGKRVWAEIDRRPRPGSHGRQPAQPALVIPSPDDP